MLGEEDKNLLAGNNPARRAYLRSVSWTDRSPTKPNPKPQQSSKARSCLPPLQPLSIARRPVEEWPKAGSDDLGVWPNPQTPRGSLKPLESPKLEKPPREFQFKKDKLAFFDKECSRIDEHIYLGSEAVAKNREILRQNGITHVLNCVGFVCPEYFKGDLVYKTLWLQDSPSEDITSILYDVFDYFEDVREQGGRVFVHCCQGVSRSTSLVIAYLMWREGQSFEDAFQYVKAAREVANPNLGFACQLLQCQKRVHAVPASPNSVLRMYRMAPHSSYDPLHLVPKMISNPDAKGLDSRGAFIVHVPKAIYVWMGRNCNLVMSNSAGTAANQVVRYERAQGPIMSIREGEEPMEFWNALQADGCSKVQGKKEEALLSSGNHEVVATVHMKIGERKVDNYDFDFELFHKALAGGVVPPFSVSSAGSETCLPARENGWGRLRHKFASGVVKEFVTSSKLNSDSTPVTDASDMIIDSHKESEDTAFQHDSLSQAAYPCGSPDSFDCFPNNCPVRVKDTCKEVDHSVPLTDSSPDSFSCSPCTSPIISSKSPTLSPSTSDYLSSFTIIDNSSLPPTPPCDSPDSFCCSLRNSPNFVTKSPVLSPSASDYSSSFTFSPSSSNWSDLSYFSSQHPSPSGFEASNPFPGKNAHDNSCLSYKETLPSAAMVFPANHTRRMANTCLPCKGSFPSIAERRGSNPPPLMILPSVDKPSEVPRNLVRSWSFSLPDLDDDMMKDGDQNQLEHEGNQEELMLDADFNTTVCDSKIEVGQDSGMTDEVTAVTTPVLYHWPTFNKMDMDCSNVLESTSAYLLFAPDVSMSTDSPGILYIWLGRKVLGEKGLNLFVSDHITSKDNHLRWDSIARNFLNQMGLPVDASLQIVREGEETEQFLNHFNCFSFQRAEEINQN